MPGSRAANAAARALATLWSPNSRSSSRPSSRSSPSRSSRRAASYHASAGTRNEKRSVRPAAPAASAKAGGSSPFSTQTLPAAAFRKSSRLSA